MKHDHDINAKFSMLFTVLFMFLLFSWAGAFGQTHTQTSTIIVNINGTNYNVVATSEMSNALTGYTQGQLDLAHTGVYDVFDSAGWDLERRFGNQEGRGRNGYWVQASYLAYDLYHPDGTTMTSFEYSPGAAGCQSGYISHQARQREIIGIVN